VIITVTDNGSGISKDAQSQIFTPNFTTKSSGTGLGLSMSKGIVENAQGELWFETMVDKGTSFFVKLPLVKVSGG
jgi:signal transduction histidine kinase